MAAPAKTDAPSRAEGFKRYVEEKKVAREREANERLDRERRVVAEVKHLPLEQRQKVVDKYNDKEIEYIERSRQQWTTDDFETLWVLGQGAFGVVRLVKKRRDTSADAEVLACKQIPKSTVHRKNHIERLFAERGILTSGDFKEQQVWIVKLYNLFQDQYNLYMIMEFMQGGDMLLSLTKRKTFTPFEAKFYTAELLEAIDAVHSRGFTHRDLKPENVMFTPAGHIKLLDFGLAKYSKEELQALEKRPALPVLSQKKTSLTGIDGDRAAPQHPPRNYIHSRVGTPQYMAPEVVAKNYSSKCDLWSIGIMVYEMFQGGVPFVFPNEERRKLYQQYQNERPARDREEIQELIEIAAQQYIVTEVLNYKEVLKIPGPLPMGRCAIEICRGFLCDADARLTIPQARKLPFFHDLGLGAGPWTPQLQAMEPPIKPDVQDLGNGKRPANFEKYKTTPLPKFELVRTDDHDKPAVYKDLRFANYTYNAAAQREAIDDVIAEALKEVKEAASAASAPPSTASAYPPAVHQADAMIARMDAVLAEKARAKAQLEVQV